MLAIAALIVGLMFPRASIAQCSPPWLPGDGFNGVDGAVLSTTVWDPDGPGPAAPLLVVGGYFKYAGRVPASNIAVWDGANWSSLGAGLGEGGVTALAVAPDGQLVAAGDFRNSGVTPVGRIARWDVASGTWLPIGPAAGLLDTNGNISALAALPGGSIIVAGSLASVCGVAVSNIARFNAASGTWTALGAGTSDLVRALAVTQAGDLIVAGDFITAGPITANRIARWSPSGGGTWSALGAGFDGGVYSLLVLPSGHIIASGGFSHSGALDIIGTARWTPAGAAGAWSALVTSFSPAAASLALHPSGDILAAGSFNYSGSNIVRFNGSFWNPVSSPAQGGFEHATPGTSGFAYPTCMSVLPGGDLFVGSNYYSTAGGVGVARIARYSAGNWYSLGNGITNPVSRLVALSGGDVLACGTFTHVSSASCSSVARWHAGGWSPVGFGLYNSSSVATVNTVAALPDGDIVAGGAFYTSGFPPTLYIARTHGGSTDAWTPMGEGFDGAVRALAVLTGGDLIVGGYFTHSGAANLKHIARWNGAAWSAIGTGLNSDVESLLALPDGTFIVGGSFTAPAVGSTSLRHVALWNGTSWVALGAGVNGTPEVLVRMSGGDIIAAGLNILLHDGHFYHIARWDGASWTPLAPPAPLGQGPIYAVHALLPLPGGELLAGGGYDDFLPSYPGLGEVNRWNGRAWSRVVNDLDEPVTGLARLSTGELLVSGRFVRVGGPGGEVSPYLARLGHFHFCSADFNCSDVLDAQDIFDFLAAWFNGDSAANVNGSPNGLEVQDIFDFLGAWFAGCS